MYGSTTWSMLQAPLLGSNAMNIDKDFLLVITSTEIGAGVTDLGAKLTDLFFKVFSESEVRPHRIIFLNSGIFLTTEGSPIEDKLKALEEGGTEIVSCITCLNYFNRMDKLIVGRPGDMKDTVDAVNRYMKVVTV
jgi:selenium metabolism protein YedF